MDAHETIKKPFKLDDSLLKAFRDLFEPEVLNKLQNAGTYPTDQQLIEMIETAFWATLQMEEGRQISFSLCFAEKNSDSLIKPFIFDKPVIFNIENLVKLSLALDSTRQFGIYFNQEKRLEIWGFGQESLVGTSKVTSIGISKLVASLGSAAMIITGDQFSLLKRSNSLLETHLFDQIYKHSKETSQYVMLIDTKFFITLRVFNSLRYITQRVRAKGHGGILIIIPPSKDWQESFEPITYLCRGEWQIANETLKASAEIFDKKPLPPATRKDVFEYQANIELLTQAHNQALNDIAALMNIDGAVILKYDLKVLAFGAKIKRQGVIDTQKILQIYPFAENSKSEGTSLPPWGTRHLSAFNFVCNHREAMVFVISEDGFITAFVNDTDRDKIVVYRHLEYFIDDVTT